jgi:hypothetical protein
MVNATTPKTVARPPVTPDRPPWGFRVLETTATPFVDRKPVINFRKSESPGTRADDGNSGISRKTGVQPPWLGS